MDRRVLKSNHFNKRLDQLRVSRMDDLVVCTCQRPTYTAWFQELVSFNKKKYAHFWLICRPQCRLTVWFASSDIDSWQNQPALFCILAHQLSPPASYHIPTPIQAGPMDWFQLRPEVRGRVRIFLSSRHQGQHIESQGVGKGYL